MPTSFKHSSFEPLSNRRHERTACCCVFSKSSCPSSQDIGSDLRSQKSAITETEQNLRLARGSCDDMAIKLQEHCPDIERQEADVQKLSKRYNNLIRQTENR